MTKNYIRGSVLSEFLGDPDIVSFGTERLRRQVLTLWGSLSLPGSRLFGGYLRDLIYSAHRMTTHIANSPTFATALEEKSGPLLGSSLQAPRMAFMDSAADIDLFFQTKETLRQFLIVLTLDYNCVQREYTSGLYKMHNLTKIKLKTKQHPLAPKLAITVDCVTPKFDDVPLLLDFDVNGLCLTPDGKIFARTGAMCSMKTAGPYQAHTLFALVNLIGKIHSREALLYIIPPLRFMYLYESAIVEASHEEKSTEEKRESSEEKAAPSDDEAVSSEEKAAPSDNEAVSSDDEAVSSDEKLEERELDAMGNSKVARRLYRNYLELLFDRRVPKMIKKGWKITNVPNGGEDEGCCYRRRRGLTFTDTSVILICVNCSARKLVYTFTY